MTIDSIIMNDQEYPQDKSDLSSPLGGGGTFQSYHFTFAEVAPTFNEVLDFLQSSDLDEVHPAIVFIRSILDELNFDAGITGGFVIKDVEEIDVKSGLLRIESTELNLGSQVCGYIKEATRVALFLCTAGEGFTQMTNALNKQGDIMEAYILDAIGSLTVEKAMDKIQHTLKDIVSNKQLKISNRYSPGYCNWPLSDQTALFELIGDHSTGILLSDSCLMTPRKSVSGIIGIGKHLKHHEYGCKICNNATCIYRKILIG